MKTCLTLILLLVNAFIANSRTLVDNKREAGYVTQFSTASDRLLFIENKGQITDQFGQQRTDIDFKTEAGGLGIFIGRGRLHYQWTKTESKPVVSGKSNVSSSKFAKARLQVTKLEMYRMDVTLAGANPDAELISEDKADYHEHYYLPQCNDKTANTYRKIIYKNIYPGIDWVLYTKGSELKYDFIVHEGADARNIKLRYDGSTDLAVHEGQLTATTPYGSVTEQAPVCYDNITKAIVPSSFVLDGNTVSFNTSGHADNIIIDPQLRWSTYYGGGSPDGGEAVAADPDGNAILVGEAQSFNNIATTGAFQTTNLGPGPVNFEDDFVVKFDAAGVRQWGTYFGGAATAIKAYTVATDGSGNIYVGGYVSGGNAGFATTGAFQTTVNGVRDGYLFKLNASGARVWATYYGGTADEEVNSIACDGANNIVMCGRTHSTTGMATAGAFQTSCPGSNYAGFIAKFSSAGARLWGSYFGGSNNEDLVSVACDLNGNVFAAGNTQGNSPVTAGAYQSTPGGSTDGIFLKMSGSGAMLWASYYGGSAADDITCVATDASGYVYIGGYTLSSSGIATANAFQSALPSFCSSFFARFNTAGVRQWGTYYGNVSTGYDEILGIAAAQSGRVYVCGNTNAPTGMATAGAHQLANAGYTDAFIAAFSVTGSRLWGSYLGGAAVDNARSMALSNVANVYIAGTTQSATGLYTVGAHQAYGGGTYDAFLAAFAADTVVYIRPPFTDTVHCVGDSMKVPYNVSQKFRGGNTFSIQLSNASGSFTSATVIGTKVSDTADTIACYIPLTTLAGAGYRIRIIANQPIDTSGDDGFNIHIYGFPNVTAVSNSPVCAGDSIKFTSSGTTAGASFSWAGPSSFSASQQNPKIPLAVIGYSGMYTDTVVLNGCKTIDTVTVVVNRLPGIPSASSNSGVCPGTTLHLTAAGISGVHYAWKGPNVFSSILQNADRSNMTSAEAGEYYVTATSDTTGCKSNDSTAVSVYPVTPTPAAGSNSPVCAGGSLNLTAFATGSNTYSWTGPNNYTANAQNPTRNNLLLGDAGIYTVVATSATGCLSGPATTNVTVIQGPSVSVYASPSDTICSGSNAALVAIPFNIGSGATYEWYKNGLSTGVTTGSLIASGINTGDKFYVLMTAGSACNTAVISNIVTMTVLPATPAPAANINATPGTTVWPGLFVSFSSNITNGGAHPTYQWMRNGHNIAGATTGSWGTTDLRDGDTVCLLVTSSDRCATPKSALSNCLVMQVPAGIGNVSDPTYHVYPNPVSKILTIDNTSIGDVLELYDYTGKRIMSLQAENRKTEMDMTALPSGVYLLTVFNETAGRWWKKVVK